MPFKIARAPSDQTGLSNERRTSESPAVTSARFSFTVFPVTVGQVGSRKDSIFFITAGTPPILWKSNSTYGPEGATATKAGTRRLISSHISRVQLMPASWAQLCRWTSELVPPQIAISTAMAFFRLFRVKIRDGFICLRARSTMHFPVALACQIFSAETATEVLEPGMEKPRASVSNCMELPVVISPQAPADDPQQLVNCSN